MLGITGKHLELTEAEALEALKEEFPGHTLFLSQRTSLYATDATRGDPERKTYHASAVSNDKTVTLGDECGSWAEAVESCIEKGAK